MLIAEDTEAMSACLAQLANCTSEVSFEYTLVTSAFNASADATSTLVAKPESI